MRESTPSNGRSAASNSARAKSCSPPWTPTACRPASIAASPAKYRASVKIPVIASGGAGKPEDFLRVFDDGEADAALAASIFHYGTYTVDDLKEYLEGEGVPVRRVKS